MKLPLILSLFMQVSRFGVCAAMCLGMSAQSVAEGVTEIEYPPRAQDLHYAEALFEYYQGRSFEALSLLNVAKVRGGISGHGDHPLLVEGGLMLSYGMTRAAKSHFEALLLDDNKERVPAEVRNQAWFYLGKVFYLENDLPAAKSAFTHIEAPLLQEANAGLYEEWLYLKVQLLLKRAPVEVSGADLSRKEVSREEVSREVVSEVEALVSQLPEMSLWRAYVTYNLAIATNTDSTKVAEALAALSAQLENPSLWRSEDQAERLELLARTRLSTAQLYLQNSEYAAAIVELNTISFDSAFSDEALFHYSVAASHAGEYELALAALKRLQERALFTPWLQQVPYALGFLYEQLGDLSLAAQAYQSAAEHYQLQLETLADKTSRLSEADIIAALVLRSNEGLANEALPALKLGVESIDNDAYGRIHVRPVDFEIAQLLSLERFQLGLRDLHELYKLRNSLSVWSQQLGSFDLMLATRAQQRNMKIQQTKDALQQQDAQHWHQQRAAYSGAIKVALKREDIEFFLDQEQIEFKQQIEKMLATLALLPAEDRADYAEPVRRIQAYFKWWVADRYSINRWQVQKSLKGLDQAMDEFNQRHNFLSRELANQDFQLDLEQRVSEAQQRLTALATELEQALQASRISVLALVKEEFERQQQEIRQYRLAARHAHARLADRLYQQGLDSDAEGDIVIDPNESTDSLESVELNEAVDTDPATDSEAASQ